MANELELIRAEELEASRAEAWPGAHLGWAELPGIGIAVDRQPPSWPTVTVFPGSQSKSRNWPPKRRGSRSREAVKLTSLVKPLPRSCAAGPGRRRGSGRHRPPSPSTQSKSLTVFVTRLYAHRWKEAYPASLDPSAGPARAANRVTLSEKKREEKVTTASLS
jgi:hypothetical protein